MTMDSSEMLDRFVGKNANLRELNEAHPGIGSMIAGVLYYSMVQTVKADIDYSLDDVQRVRGKSGYRTRAQAAVDLDADPNTGYVRPNGEMYYSRKWGEHEDVAVLRKARTEKQYILLYGQPGCGKTALIEGAFGEEMYTVMGEAATTRADFVGGWVPKPGGGYEWNDGPLVKAMEEGKVLFIDEIGVIDTKELTGLYGVMDGRDVLTISENPSRPPVKAAEGFYVISATNPNAPGVRLSEALLSRHLIQAEMTTDWGLLSTKFAVPGSIISFAENANRKFATGDLGWAPQFRELAAYVKLEKTFGRAWACANLVALAPESDRKDVEQLLSTFTSQAVKRARI